MWRRGGYEAAVDGAGDDRIDSSRWLLDVSGGGAVRMVQGVVYFLMDGDGFPKGCEIRFISELSRTKQIMQVLQTFKKR